MPPEDHYPYFAHNFGTIEKPDRKYCICYSCAKADNMNACNHSDVKDRAIIVTSSVSEINYGIQKKKYQIIQLCELYSYKTGAWLFKDFVRSVEETKDSLSDSIMSKFLKAGVNASYGSFIQRNSEDKHKLCANISEFQNLLLSTDVQNFDLITEKYLDVCYKNKTPENSNPFSNHAIGIHILSYSRMIMDEKIDELKRTFKSAKLFMQNVDCIAFSVNSEEDISKMNLDNNKIGFLKNEIKDAKEILSFHALSPHFYNICYINNSGQEKNLSKVCGFSLKNSVNSDLLNRELFHHFISEALNGHKASISSTQIRSHRDKDTNELKERISKFQLRNSLFKKRVIMKDGLDIILKPFGFTKKYVDLCQ